MLHRGIEAVDDVLLDLGRPDADTLQNLRYGVFLPDASTTNSAGTTSIRAAVTRDGDADDAFAAALEVPDRPPLDS